MKKENYREAFLRGIFRNSLHLSRDLRVYSTRIPYPHLPFFLFLFSPFI